MSSLNALMVAIDAASRKRDEARQAVQERQRAQQAAQAQMDQLQNYVQEMQARWGVQENQSVQPEVMFHQYQFMDRLQHAIGLQTRVLADLAIRLEAAQKP
jgi:flagellar FliJ protein